MAYSWNLGRICGIQIKLHWSFLLLPAWVVLSSLAAGAGLASAAAASSLLAIAFGCVVLHELGHALMARRFGIATRDITLLPIGGMARLERMPRKPGQEAAIALAGPLVNLAIAASLMLGHVLSGSVGPMWSLLPQEGSLWTTVAGVNLALAVFNLLPAFPMDGGRVLRALLAWKLPYVRATRIAAVVAQGMAICLAAIGLLGNLSLLLVAVFVFFAAQSEARAVAAEARASWTPAPVPAELSMGDRPGPVVLLPAHARTADVAPALLPGQQYFPVVRCGAVVGVVSRADLLRVLAAAQGDRLVAEVMMTSASPWHTRLACE